MGLYLAVTTFALALATERWLLNSTYFDWFPAPDERFERPPLFGRIDVESPTAFYFYSVAVLAVVYFAVRGIRRSRTGRVIIAMRENERGAQAYAVPVVRAKLTAFVISGVVAGVAGALLVHGNRSFTGTQFGVAASFEVFTSAVIGGLGSLGGALLGALYLRGTRWFITSQEWQLLSTGVGVLVVLLILPGGLGSLWVKLRDVAVRLLTRRRSWSSGRSDSPGVGTDPARRRNPPSWGSARRVAGTRAGRSAHMSRFTAAVRHPMTWLGTVCGGESAYPLVVLFGLNAVDELDRTAFGILLPNIRDEFGLDTTTVLTLVAVASVAALALQVPIAQFADRARRVPLAIAGALVWGVFSGMTGTGRRRRHARHRPQREQRRQGGHRSDAQLAARRLLPDPGPHRRLQHAPGGERRRQLRRPARRRPAGLLVRVARAVPRVRRPHRDLRLARLPDRSSRRVVAGSARPPAPSEDVVDTEEAAPSFAESWRTVQKIDTLKRLWWSLPFLATALIGFVVLASLFYDEQFGLDERARGIAAADRRAVPARRAGPRHAHRHAPLPRRHAPA